MPKHAEFWGFLLSEKNYRGVSNHFFGFENAFCEPLVKAVTLPRLAAEWNVALPHLAILVFRSDLYFTSISWPFSCQITGLVQVPNRRGRGKERALIVTNSAISTIIPCGFWRRGHL